MRGGETDMTPEEKYTALKSMADEERRARKQAEKDDPSLGAAWAIAIGVALLYALAIFAVGLYGLTR